MQWSRPRNWRWLSVIAAHNDYSRCRPCSDTRWRFPTGPRRASERHFVPAMSRRCAVTSKKRPGTVSRSTCRTRSRPDSRWWRHSTNTIAELEVIPSGCGRSPNYWRRNWDSTGSPTTSSAGGLSCTTWESSWSHRRSSTRMENPRRRNGRSSPDIQPRVTGYSRRWPVGWATRLTVRANTMNVGTERAIPMVLRERRSR